MLPQEHRKYTYEDFLKIAKDSDERIEFINGEIYCQSTPTLRHQRILGRIFARLLNYFEGKPCEAFTAPFNIVFGNDNAKERVQPDIFVICGDKNIDENEYNGIPALIIEVLSPSNSNWDYVKKMDLYARFGVREYWIVSPMSSTVQVFILEERAYKEPITYSKDDIVKSDIFNDFSLEIKAIF